ncbi:MAG: lexA 1 [Phycisphaerales bacterium]|nr:lexA 1 [Phycisphaerales bacterium]
MRGRVLFVSSTYGQRIRKARVARALSQDTLAETVGISKAYLSLIENGHLNNPPVDEKLLKLEAALGFQKGDLLHEAHLARTPKDIRAVLATLAGGTQTGHGSGLDTAYLSGVLQKAVEARTANVEPVRLAAVPVINRVSAGGPSEFSDLSHPKAEADEYVGCPKGINGDTDPDAFAARVSGDSMFPKYTAGDVVIFSPAATVREGDDCYVRLEDGQTTFKRVYFQTAEDGSEVARLVPRNAKYDVRVVPVEQITGVYRAVYRYQSLAGD